MAQIDQGEVMTWNDNEKILVYTNEGHSSVWLEINSPYGMGSGLYELNQERAAELAGILLRAAGQVDKLQEQIQKLEADLDGFVHGSL